VRGHGEFVVRVERPGEALALLRAQPWGTTARLDHDNTIITPAPEGRGRELNVFLVQAGYAPDTVTQYSQDLEQVFLQLTHSGRGANS
jgi:ABC-2 type transport system ATP-binding protein